jgi:hypothetical protein
MSNGNEQKSPPPPPPPPGGPKPGGAGGVQPADGNQNPPQKLLRLAAGMGGAACANLH